MVPFKFWKWPRRDHIALAQHQRDGKIPKKKCSKQIYILFSCRVCIYCLFLQLKVALAPCIEGLILLDRLCYLKEQVKFHISGPRSKEYCWYRLQNAYFCFKYWEIYIKKMICAGLKLEFE